MGCVLVRAQIAVIGCSCVTVSNFSRINIGIMVNHTHFIATTPSFIKFDDVIML